MNFKTEKVGVVPIQSTAEEIVARDIIKDAIYTSKVDPYQ